MNATKLVAIVLIAAGVLGLIYHGFTYTRSGHETHIGSLQLAVRHHDTVIIPDWLGAGAIALGVVLLVFDGRRS